MCLRATIPGRLEVSMRGFGRVCAAVIMVLAAIPVAAGDVGVLDAQRAVQEVEEGKRQFALLADWAAERQQDIDGMRSRIAELNAQYNQQRTVASADVLKTLEDQIRVATRELEDVTRNFNREADAKQRELLDDVAREVGNVAKEFAEANDFDVVLVYDGQPLVYLRPSADITDRVIELYNQKNPVN
jgi:outer membrane protein